MLLRILASGLVLVCAGAVQAAGAYEYRCMAMKWTTNEQLVELLNEQGGFGWQLGGFVKGSRPCLKRLKTDARAIEHLCTTSKWRNVGELTRALNDYSEQGWEFVGSSRPSQLCMARTTGAAAAAASEEPIEKAPHSPTETGGSQSKTAPAKKDPQSKEQKTRANAAELHKQLSKEELKQQLAAGKISQEDYDARVKEIEQP